MNYNADPLTFSNEFGLKFKNEIEQMVDVLFTRSIYEAEKGLHHSAISDTLFILQLLQYSPGDRTAYIIGFLTQLFIDLDDIPSALQWWKRGWESFDKDNPDNEDIVESFRYLDDILNGEDWKAI